MLGPDAKTLSDEALLRTAIERSGLSALSRPLGPLAIAWWNEDELILYRDATGRLPLYVRIAGEQTAFSHSALELAQAVGKPRIDKDWLAAYLLTLPERGPRSPFQGVSRVPPGHVMRVRRDGTYRLDRWWQPDLDTVDVGFEDAVREGERLLDRALSPDRDLPLTLSAGVDSNVLLSRLAAMGVDVEAMTASPASDPDPWDGGWTDEGPLAAQAMEALGGSVHHQMRVAPTGLREAIAWGFDAAEQPMYNPSNLGWTDALGELASGLRRQAYLIGTAGNFTLGHGGLDRIEILGQQRDWAALASIFWQSRGHGLRSTLKAYPPGPLRPIFARKSAQRHVAAVMANRNSTTVMDALWPEIHAGHLVDRPDDGIGDPSRRLNDFVLHRDPGAYSLMSVRRHGTLGIDPYANPALVEYAMRLPNHVFTNGNGTRRLQRAMLDERLPSAIRDMEGRGVQGSDWRWAARRDVGLMKSVIDRIEDGHRGADLFDTVRLRALHSAWPAAGWRDKAQVMAYRVHLQRALTSAAFAQWVEEL
ncbi:asparagine synthase-related protein [Sphingomicrobium sediminis]|uniref:asparagine synthase (glutamine-hydrolyzing) n=1 Tax=Sphingomicrobium sediminis TaxID=2950949 RepID=A0A9X2EMX1_9SPHN|nr:asparagine synthase-related protein [Sphingomicrobium sediminis]MCM8558314.1 asparagine synthase-related protein [Sphingomicrobium sediminis]